MRKGCKFLQPRRAHLRTDWDWGGSTDECVILAQVFAHLEQVSPLLVQVRFYSPHLRHEIPFYALQWRRSPTLNRTCARNTETCTISSDTCAKNTETCTICRNTCTKTAAPAPTRAQFLVTPF